MGAICYPFPPINSRPLATARARGNAVIRSYLLLPASYSRPQKYVKRRNGKCRKLPQGLKPLLFLAFLRHG